MKYKNISENLLVYLQPGIYRIECLKNKKVYIGESNSVLSRLEIHGSQLKKNMHENSEMQKDFKKYKIENFAFHVLYIGPEWKDPKKRLEKENEILLTYKPDQVYNNYSLKEKPNTKNFRYTCEINGKHYESVSQASRELNIKEKIITIRLKNGEPGYVITGKKFKVTPLSLSITLNMNLLMQ